MADNNNNAQPKTLSDISLDEVLDRATNAILYDEFIDTLDYYGWRKLASQLNCTMPQVYRYEKQSSPTKAMLEDWVQHDKSVQVLIDALKKIEHYSAIRILMAFVQPLLPRVPRQENFVIPNQRECVFDNSQLGPEDKQKKANTGKYLWPKNSVLKVFFIDNKPEINKKVLLIASEWTPHSTIQFVETTNQQKSHIRITYYGIASTVLGNLATQVDPDGKFKYEKTMYLDGLHAIQDESVFKRFVLHEFGHALGLIHEVTHCFCNF